MTNEYVRKNITILGRSNATVEKLLYEQGRLFCPEATDHDFGYDPDVFYSKSGYEPFMALYKAHAQKPLLYIEKDGKCTAVPASKSSIFVRHPDNFRDCFTNGKILTQMEVAEVICICGVCRDWHLKASKRKPSNFNNFNWIGIENNLYPQDKNQDTLVKRLENWLYYKNFLDSDEKNFKTFMIENEDYVFR